MGVYQSVRAAVTKYHGIGRLNNRHFFFSQIWRLEVQDQNVGRFGSPLGLQMAASHCCPHRVLPLCSHMSVS